MHCRQRPQVTVGRRSADFGPPMQIGHAAPQNTPGVLASRIAFRAPPDSKVLGLVDGGLRAQHAALIISFDRVLVEPVLDAHPVRTAPPVGLNFIVSTCASGSAHETEHLLAPIGHHRVMHQRRVDAFQGDTIFEHHIGSVLAFGGGPVVVALNRPGDLGVQGMAQLDQRSHQLGPVSAVLFVQQCLGAPQVTHPAKAVIFPSIFQPSTVHLTCQPLAAIDANLHEKGKPSLHSHAEPAHLFMDQVKIEMDTFAPLQLQFQLPGGFVTASKPSATRLDATDDRHQSGTDALPFFDFQSDLLFVGPAGRQINHRPAMLLGQSCPGLADAVRKANSEGFEVLPQDTRPFKIVLHDRRVVEAAQGALESEPIPTVQQANDIGLVLLYKWLRSIVCLGIESLLHNSLLPNGRCSVISSPSLVAAQPRWVH